MAHNVGSEENSGQLMIIDDTLENALVITTEDPICTYCSTSDYERMGDLSRTVYECGHSAHKECAIEMDGCGVYACIDTRVDLPIVNARALQRYEKWRANDSVIRDVLYANLPALLQPQDIPYEDHKRMIDRSSIAHLVAYTTLGVIGGVAPLGVMAGLVDWYRRRESLNVYHGQNVDSDANGSSFGPLYADVVTDVLMGVGFFGVAMACVIAAPLIGLSEEGALGARQLLEEHNDK